MSDINDPWVGQLVPHPFSARQAAHEAAFKILDEFPTKSEEEYNRLWTAVHAALDAADVSIYPSQR